MSIFACVPAGNCATNLARGKYTTMLIGLTLKCMTTSFIWMSYYPASIIFPWSTCALSPLDVSFIPASIPSPPYLPAPSSDNFVSGFTENGRLKLCHPYAPSSIRARVPQISPSLQRPVHAPLKAGPPYASYPPILRHCSTTPPPLCVLSTHQPITTPLCLSCEKH